MTTTKTKTKKEIKAVTITSDGACLGNPGPGGWAVVLEYGRTQKLFSGHEKHTTNNRMEMTAVIEGLKKLKETCKVHITTDSKYVLDAFEKDWIGGWVSRNWRTSSGDDVKNQDLWQELIELVGKHKVTWEWVKGHSGHVMNELVDAKAQEEARIASRLA